MIGDLYPIALDGGILPEAFWSSSLAEVRDRLESFQRVRVQNAKEKISLCYKLAGLIGIYVSKLFDDKNEVKIPYPWDSYPELFGQEKERYEAIHVAELAEETRETRHAYADRHNRLRREAENAGGGDGTRKE